LLHRSADYCNAQLVYYTFVGSLAISLLFIGECCREEAKLLAKHRKTALEAVAYLPPDGIELPRISLRVGWPFQLASC